MLTLVTPQVPKNSWVDRGRINSQKPTDKGVLIIYHLVICYIAMENPSSMEVSSWENQWKSSISIGHLYHGYLWHNQMVFWGGSPNWWLHGHHPLGQSSKICAKIPHPKRLLLRQAAVMKGYSHGWKISCINVSSGIWLLKHVFYLFGDHMLITINIECYTGWCPPVRFAGL